MEIGERLKRAPMGYFNENRLGDITAAVTTTLGDLEQLSVTIMENVAGGFIHAIVIGVWLMIYSTGFTGKLQYFLMLQAIYNLCILIPQKLPANSLGALSNVISLFQIVVCFCLFTNHSIQSLSDKYGCHDKSRPNEKENTS